MARFLVVPQWQGSSAARAMLLTDGAAAIAGDLPRSATVLVDVPLEAGDSLDSGVRRFSTLLQVQTLLAERIAPGDIIVGGDASVTASALAALQRTDEDLSGLGLLWCAAQPGLHEPRTAPTGSFAEMSLRSVLGAGPLALEPGIRAEQIVLLGARDMTAAEQPAAAALTALDAERLGEGGALPRAFATTSATRFWAHIDLGVLDPADLSGTATATPFGVRAAELIRAIRELRAVLPLAGATVAGFMPRTPEAAVDDLGTILRLLGALT